MPRYNRALVKISGEALQGPDAFGIHQSTIRAIAEDLKTAAETGVELAVVIGGGNLVRGAQIAGMGLSRAAADSMGRIATVMNAIAMEAQLEAVGQTARAMSADPMPSIIETYSRQRAASELSKGRIVLLAGGVGAPFFTTDTGAALRAAELDCAVLLKATNVDGVYTADPKKDQSARRYERLTHDEAISKSLKVMDTAAFALAKENRLPVIVFSIREPGAITAALAGGLNATLVTP